MEQFITEIKIRQLRHLKNIEIDLSHEKRQHLLLTGKNGSGKTSCLEILADCLKGVVTITPTIKETKVKQQKKIP